MAAIILISIVAWIIAMRRLGASLIVILLMFMTPQLWWSIVYGNLDFLVVLGIILPSPLGLFFVLSKPQAGAGIAIYWLIRLTVRRVAQSAANHRPYYYRLTPVLHPVWPLAMDCSMR